MSLGEVGYRIFSFLSYCKDMPNTTYIFTGCFDNENMAFFIVVSMDTKRVYQSPPIDICPTGDLMLACIRLTLGIEITWTPYQSTNLIDA